MDSIMNEVLLRFAVTHNDVYASVHLNTNLLMFEYQDDH